MQSQVELLHTNRIVTNRPDSSQLVDLHIYIIPRKVWKNRQNLADNETMEQAISAGFVRVPETLTLHDLRRYIVDVCSEEINFPKEFIYLRSVGRCFTKVKHQQEKELKVKNYRPPLTIASEVFILEQNHKDNSSSVNQQIMTPQSWIRPIDGSSLPYPLFNHNSIVIPNNEPSCLVKLSPRDLLKSRAEQERLYVRQLELAEKRHEIEEENARQEEAAIKIQNAFRNYRHRQNLKQQQHEDDTIEIKRLQKEARELTRRKTEEREAHDVVRLSHRLEDLRAKRMELETNRNQVVRRMQQLHTQITIRRREEKDLWKQKYIIEKNQITLVEEQNRMYSKTPTDIHIQLERARARLNNTTKLRQRAESESRILRHELQQISSTLNAIERYRLPKESSSSSSSQHQQTEPISLDITLQY